MSIRNGDYCLSGRVWESLEVTAVRLLNLEAIASIEELRLRVGFDREAELVLANELAGLDLAETIRVEARLDIKTLASRLVMCLARGDKNEPPNTIIDCMVYLDHLHDERSTPHAALHAFVDVMAGLAAQLGARWLHLACEDDERLMVGGGLRLPDVCGIYRPDVLDGLLEPLRAAGAIVDEEPIRGYLVVWLAPIDALLAERPVPIPEGAHAIIRERLSKGDV